MLQFQLIVLAIVPIGSPQDAPFAPVHLPAVACALGLSDAWGMDSCERTQCGAFLLVVSDELCQKDSESACVEAKRFMVEAAGIVSEGSHIVGWSADPELMSALTGQQMRRTANAATLWAFAPRHQQHVSPAKTKKDRKRGKALRRQTERLTALTASEHSNAVWALAADAHLLNPQALGSDLLLNLIARNAVAGTGQPCTYGGSAHPVFDGAAWRQAQPALVDTMPSAVKLTIQLHIMLDGTVKEYAHDDAAQLIKAGAMLSPWDGGKPLSATSESMIGLEAAEAAAASGHHTKLARMDALGLDLAGWRSADGWTLLHIACGRTTTHQPTATDRIETVKMLLDRGANVSAQTPSGHTATMLAALLFPAAMSAQTGGESWASRVFSLVVSYGLDLSLAAADGRTLLHIATATHDIALIGMLRQHYLATGGPREWGGAVALADRFGQSAMHLAAGEISNVVTATKQAMAAQPASGDDDCDRQLLAAYESSVQLAQRNALKAAKRRMAERGEIPGFGALQESMRLWRNGARSFSDLLKHAEMVLPNPSGRELFLQDLYTLSVVNTSEVGSVKLDELTRVLLSPPLISDPLGFVGISQQQVRQAHTKCKYNAQALLQLTQDSGNALVEVLQKKDHIGRTPLFIAAQAGATDAVQVLLGAGSRASAAVLQAAAASGCSECLDLLGGQSRSYRGEWWTSTEASRQQHSAHRASDVQLQGGWAGRVQNKQVQQLSDLGCDGRIAVKQRISWSELRDDFITAGRPLLLLAPYDEVTASTERTAWSLETLLQKYGGTSVTQSSIPYASSVYGLSNAEKDVELRQFISEEMVGRRHASDNWSLGDERKYIFNLVSGGRGFGHSAMAASMNASYHGGDQHFTSLQVYLGPPGSGAPQHFHMHAVNHLIFGRKFWSLLPPEESRITRQSLSRWLREDPDAVINHTLTCVQPAGSALYVPAGWGHGVLNLEESVGYAREFVVLSNGVHAKRRTLRASREGSVVELLQTLEQWSGRPARQRRPSAHVTTSSRWYRVV